MNAFMGGDGAPNLLGALSLFFDFSSSLLLESLPNFCPHQDLGAVLRPSAGSSFLPAGLSSITAPVLSPASVMILVVASSESVNFLRLPFWSLMSEKKPVFTVSPASLCGPAREGLNGDLGFSTTTAFCSIGSGADFGWAGGRIRGDGGGAAGLALSAGGVVRAGSLKNCGTNAAGGGSVTVSVV